MSSGTESPRERHGGRSTATLAVILSACACASATPGTARGADVSEALTARLADAADREIPVVVTLAQQVDETRYAGRPAALVRALRATAGRTQSTLTARMHRPARRFWLVNAVATTASAAEVSALAADPAVATIDVDPSVTVAGSASTTLTAGSWGVGAINAPSAWSTYGVTGAGVWVGSIDTGVDATNPELAGAIAGWRDFVGGQPAPYDDNGHGTHTIGTMVARNVGGAPVGVAPGARVIVAKAIRADGTALGSDLLAAAQWMTDPDGDPSTPDFPAVINNSWTSAGANNEWFRPMVQTWVAMGIVPVFGVGNTTGGPGNPASYPESIAVGALEETGLVTVNSSRGTVSWVGSDQSTMTIGKPDITAPGTFITSTVGTGYGVYSGSSMAAPHVTATVALIKQAHPDMGPQAIRAALTAGAIDRGVPGPDLDYGAGALDAAGALAAAGADPLAGPAPATPVNAAASEPPTLRVLRVTRRGGSLVIQGRVSAPVRLRAQIRRSVKVLNSTAVTATAVSRRAGRFVLRLPARSLTRGRYVVVVTASNAAGKRLVSVSRAVRLT